MSRFVPGTGLLRPDVFRGRRRFVEATCAQLFILWARHVLVEPDEVLAPYE